MVRTIDAGGSTLAGESKHEGLVAIMNNSHAREVSELVDQHGEMVFATAYRILGNSADAEDVYQDVFMKLVRGWERILGSGTVREWGAYLRVVTTRRAVDILRRRNRRKHIGVEWVEQLEGPKGTNPRAIVMRNEMANIIRRALARLPKKESRVFCLKYFEGLSYEQIAGQAGISVDSVGVLLHRARKHLRKLLDPSMLHSIEPTPVADQPAA